MSELQQTAAAQAEAEQLRPGRRTHLEKIATSVAPREFAADDASRSAGRVVGGIIRNVHPHAAEPGSGR